MWLGFTRESVDLQSEEVRRRWLSGVEASGTGASTPDRWLHCRGCGTRIAHLQDVLEGFGGSPYPVFRNPSGQRFTLILLRQAERLVDQSPAIREDTWFPGYAWVIQSCAGCGGHLGWRYEGPGLEPPRFWGLIRDRLVVLDFEA